MPEPEIPLPEGVKPKDKTQAQGVPLPEGVKKKPIGDGSESGQENVIPLSPVVDWGLSVYKRAEAPPPIPPRMGQMGQPIAIPGQQQQEQQQQQAAPQIQKSIEEQRGDAKKVFTDSYNNILNTTDDHSNLKQALFNTGISTLKALGQNPDELFGDDKTTNQANEYNIIDNTLKNIKTTVKQQIEKTEDPVAKDELQKKLKTLNNFNNTLIKEYPDYEKKLDGQIQMSILSGQLPGLETYNSAVRSFLDTGAKTFAGIYTAVINRTPGLDQTKVQQSIDYLHSKIEAAAKAVPEPYDVTAPGMNLDKVQNMMGSAAGTIGFYALAGNVAGKMIGGVLPEAGSIGESGAISTGAGANTSMAGNIISMMPSLYFDAYNKATEAGITDKSKKELYAIPSAILSSSIYTFLPALKQVKGLSGEINEIGAKEFASAIAKGSPFESAWKQSSDAIINMVGKSAENAGLMTANDVVDKLNQVLQNQVNPQAKFKPDFDINTLGQEFLANAISFAPFGVSEGIQHLNKEGMVNAEAMNAVINNPDAMMKSLSDLKINKSISEEQYKRGSALINGVKETLTKIPAETPYEDKVKLLPLISDKIKLEEQLSTVAENFKPKIQLELDALNNKIDKIANPDGLPSEEEKPKTKEAAPAAAPAPTPEPALVVDELTPEQYDTLSPENKQAYDYLKKNNPEDIPAFKEEFFPKETAGSGVKPNEDGNQEGQGKKADEAQGGKEADEAGKGVLDPSAGNGAGPGTGPKPELEGKKISEFNPGDLVKNTIGGEVSKILSIDGDKVKIKEVYTPAGELASGKEHEIDASKIPDHILYEDKKPEPKEETPPAAPPAVGANEETKKPEALTDQEAFAYNQSFPGFKTKFKDATFEEFEKARDGALEKMAKLNYSEKSKLVANKLRSLKSSNRAPEFDKDGNKIELQTNSFIDDAIEIAAKAIEAGGHIADAIKSGIDHIKSTDWYKGLKASERAKELINFEKQITDKYQKATEIPKSFNEHVFDSINSSKDGDELKNSISEKEAELLNAGETEMADKLKGFKESIKPGEDVGDITNRLLDQQIKESDPFRSEKVHVGQKFINNIGDWAKNKLLKTVSGWFHKVFPSNSVEAETARQLLRKEQGTLKSEIQNLVSGKNPEGVFQSLGITATADSLRAMRDLFDKVGSDGSFKFMNIMQGLITGDSRDATLASMDKQYGLASGTMQKSLEGMRDISDQLYNMVTEHADVDYVVDYLAGMYKDKEKAKTYFTGKLSNIAGKKSFLKQKFYENYLQAKNEGGLEPLYDNPADIVSQQIGNVMQYVFANRVLDAFKENKLVNFYSSPKDAPAGWKLVEDPIFKRQSFVGESERTLDASMSVDENYNVTFVDPTLKVTSTRANVGGGWYMPEDAADMVNNRFGSGVIDKGVYDAIRGINNFYTRADLSLSYFHTMMTSMNSLASQFGGATQALTAGKGMMALKELARVPLASDLISGLKINRDYRNLKNLKEELKTATPAEQVKIQSRIDNVENLISGNHSFNQDKMYRMDVFDGFKRAINRGEYLTAAMKAPFAAVDAFGKPLFEIYVPAIKSAIAARDAAREIQLVHPETDVHAQRLIDRAIDSSDEMFGQIAHDNLFFDNTLKQLGNMGSLAFGYSRGTLMVAGRPLTELLRYKEGEGFKSETLDRIFKGQGIPLGTAKFLGIVMSTAVVGAMVQKILSGKNPESEMDLIAPRTGETNPDGTEKRLVLANYLSKDYYGYAHGFINELTNKSSPLIRVIAELKQNKDFYGQQIYGEDEKGWEKAWDMVKFAGKEAVPFTFRKDPSKEYENYSKAKVYAMQFFGIREANKTMERNTWENAIVDEIAKKYEYINKPRTERELDKSRMKGTAAREIYGGYKELGVELLHQMVDKGYIKKNEIPKIEKESKNNPYYNMFKNLTPEGQLTVMTNKNVPDDVKYELRKFMHNREVYNKFKEDNKDLFERHPEYDAIIKKSQPYSILQ